MRTWSHEPASHQSRVMSGRVTSQEWTSCEDSRPTILSILHHVGNGSLNLGACEVC